MEQEQPQASTSSGSGVRRLRVIEFDFVCPTNEELEVESAASGIDEVPSDDDSTSYVTTDYEPSGSEAGGDSEPDMETTEEDEPASFWNEENQETEVGNMNRLVELQLHPQAPAVSERSFYFDYDYDEE